MSDSDVDDEPPCERSSGRSGACWAAVAVLFVVGMSAVGRLANTGASLLPGQDARALGSAVQEVIRAAELPKAERDAALREVLKRLESSRTGRATPEEKKLIGTVHGLLGEVVVPEPRGGQRPAAPDPNQVLDALRGLDPEQAALRLAELARGEQPTAPTPDAAGPPPTAGDAAAGEGAPPTVGQWVTLREETGGASPTVHLTYRWISAVKPDTIEVSVLNLSGDPPHRPLGEPLVTFLPRGAQLLPPPGAPRERVVAGGTAWDCARIETPGPGGTAVSTWTTLQLPVYLGLPGFVQQVVRDGQGNERSRTVLAGWGRTGGGRTGPP